jgi:hypothetical protein
MSFRDIFTLAVAAALIVLAAAALSPPYAESLPVGLVSTSH